MLLIAAPCVIGSDGLVLDTFGKLQKVTDALGIEHIAKSSFTKANGSSISAFAGPILMWV